MADDHNGRATSGDGGKQMQDRGGDGGIQCTCWFVGNQQGGFGGKRTRNRNPLALAHG